jgi:hypothetical protein
MYHSWEGGRNGGREGVIREGVILEASAHIVSFAID